MKKLTALILALFCVGGVLGCKQITNIISNFGPFGNGGATVFEPHREDFLPVIEDSILKQFENDSEVIKAYILRTND